MQTPIYNQIKEGYQLESWGHGKNFGEASWEGLEEEKVKLYNPILIKNITTAFIFMDFNIPREHPKYVCIFIKHTTYYLEHFLLYTRHAYATIDLPILLAEHL